MKMMLAVGIVFGALVALPTLALADGDDIPPGTPSVAGPPAYRASAHWRQPRRVVCRCHVAYHVVHRRGHPRVVGGSTHYGPVVPAASVGASDPYQQRPVVGRMIAPPSAFNPLQDRDTSSSYLGAGGSATAVLHLPSLRGDVTKRD